MNLLSHYDLELDLNKTLAASGKRASSFDLYGYQTRSVDVVQYFTTYFCTKAFCLALKTLHRILSAGIKNKDHFYFAIQR